MSNNISPETRPTIAPFVEALCEEHGIATGVGLSADVYFRAGGVRNIGFELIFHTDEGKLETPEQKILRTEIFPNAVGKLVAQTGVDVRWISDPNRLVLGHAAVMSLDEEPHALIETIRNRRLHYGLITPDPGDSFGHVLQEGMIG